MTIPAITHLCLDVPQALKATAEHILSRIEGGWRTISQTAHKGFFRFVIQPIGTLARKAAEAFSKLHQLVRTI